MTLLKNAALAIFFGAIPAAVSAASLRTRDLVACSALKGCFLVDLQTGKELKLVDGESYPVAEGNMGYSVRCDISDEGELNYMKFHYEDKVQEEWDKHRWMNGDSHDGAFVNPVPYLSTCGSKRLRVEGNIWSAQCFDVTYNFESTCTEECPVFGLWNGNAMVAKSARIASYSFCHGRFHQPHPAVCAISLAVLFSTNCCLWPTRRCHCSIGVTCGNTR